MATRTFFKRIKLELPIRLRKKRLTSKVKENKPMTMCVNCRCTDLEDWLDCYDKK